jgi:hypothetical protein
MTITNCEKPTDEEPSATELQAPDSLRAELTSIGEEYRHIELFWSEVSSATSYDIYKGTSASNLEFFRNMIKPAPGHSLVYPIRGDMYFTKGTTYYFGIKAKSADGTSAFSPIKSCLYNW